MIGGRRGSNGLMCVPIGEKRVSDLAADYNVPTRLVHQYRNHACACVSVGEGLCCLLSQGPWHPIGSG